MRECLTDFFRIVKLLREMSQIMSVPLFFITFYSLNTIFTAIYILVIFRNTLDYSFAADTTFNLISGFVILIMNSVTSSMIPEKLSDIKITAREKLNQHACGTTPYVRANILLCLKRIEAEELIYISVCGLFPLTKSLILSATGAILSYDLLIINVLHDDEKKIA